MSDSIQVTLSTDRVVVSLGEKTEVTAEIHNLSDVVEVFSIEVEGIPSDWYTLSVTSVSLFPGDKETIRLVVAPPVTTAAAAGSDSVAHRQPANCSYGCGEKSSDGCSRSQFRS